MFLFQRFHLDFFRSSYRGFFFKFFFSISFKIWTRSSSGDSFWTRPWICYWDSACTQQSFCNLLWIFRESHHGIPFGIPTEFGPGIPHLLESGVLTLTPLCFLLAQLFSFGFPRDKPGISPGVCPMMPQQILKRFFQELLQKYFLVLFEEFLLFFPEFSLEFSGLLLEFLQKFQR